MKTNHTRQLVAMSLLVALMIIFAFTPLGYLRVGIAAVTFLCLPIAVGTVVLGFVPGLVLSSIFALTSLYQLITAPSGLFGFIYALSGLWPLALVLVIPRLLIPVFTHLVNRLFKKARPFIRYGIAGLTASLTNTVFVLGSTYLIFGNVLDSFFESAMQATVKAGLGIIVLTNGLPEAAAAVIICAAILTALKKAIPSVFYDGNAIKADK